MYYSDLDRAVTRSKIFMGYRDKAKRVLRRKNNRGKHLAIMPTLDTKTGLAKISSENNLHYIFATAYWDLREKQIA